MSKNYNALIFFIKNALTNGLTKVENVLSVRKYKLHITDNKLNSNIN